MEYVLPKALAKTHSISLKTVYNYLSKYPDRIKVRREFWKRVVNQNDFWKIVKRQLQNYKIVSNTPPVIPVKTESWKQLWTIENNFESLQSEFNLVTIKQEELTKQNRNLTEQANNLVVWLNDEKNAKKELEGKYDQLQGNYNDKIESFSLEKIKLLKRYYLVLSLSLVCALVLFFFQLPTLLDYFWK